MALKLCKEDQGEKIEEKFPPTASEAQAMNNLVGAWDCFIAAYGRNEDDELRDYRQAIHTCQRIIEARIFKRARPNEWRI